MDVVDFPIANVFLGFIAQMEENFLDVEMLAVHAYVFHVLLDKFLLVVK